ncbi:MAG: flagellar motor switch protein FliM [Myxococcales bacterium]|nr:flagellar motor switch protein FliM [Myxococcales bacterium]
MIAPVDTSDDSRRGGEVVRAETLIALTSGGGSALAEETLRRAGTALAQNLRRGVPVLGKRRAVVIPGEPSTVLASDFGKDLDGPVFVAPLAAEPGGSRAMLAVDASTIALLFEGALGGDGADPPQLNPKGLTAPQRAFMDRIAGGIVQSLGSALARHVGLSLTKLAPQTGNERSADGALVQLPLHIREQALSAPASQPGGFGLDDFDSPSPAANTSDEPQEGALIGTILLAVSKTALNAARAANTQKRAEGIDPRVAATVREVLVQVVVELGRVRMTLGKIGALRVGDTLRLDVPVNGDVDVRVENQVLFTGQPTTVGTQLAVQIVARHEASRPGFDDAQSAAPPRPRGA